MEALSDTPESCRGQTTPKATAAEANTRELVDSFSQYFEIVPATTSALQEMVFRIRYQVYAEELGWEDQTQFPAELEKDEYDDHSLHCLLKHKLSGSYIGCVRLVQNNPEQPHAWFPIEQTFDTDFVQTHPSLASHHRHQVGEISRIAVLSSFRHRHGEKNKPNTDIEDGQNAQSGERRRFPHIALGLYLAAGAMGIANGNTCVFAMMEPKLARRLRIFGIKFEQLSDPIEHRGLRAPFVVTHENFCGSFAPPMTALLDHISASVA
ncbi:MAG: PEP-CTERM/exosortase system-associated acyltransferase [Pseudomonadota bacterium]